MAGKYPTIDALMREVGCTRYPARWCEIYDAVMADFDRNGGTRLCDPDFYRDLHARYAALPTYLDVVCEAAVEIGKREGLARLLALVGASQADRKNAWADVKAFTAPTPPAPTRDFAVDMLTGLATISTLSLCHENMEKRGIPQEIILGTTTMLEGGIREFAKRHGGAYGYHLMWWNQRAIDGILFRIGRLEIELCKYDSPSVVFEDGEGNTVTLADGTTFHKSGAVLGAYGYTDKEGAFVATLTETDDAYVGHPYDALGRASTETVTLPKSTWHKRLCAADNIIALHIPPSGGAFTPEAIDETLTLAADFVKTYFPEWNSRGFTCDSWLLDPQLEELLGKESNIVKFGRRFSLVGTESPGKSPFYFVYMRPNEEQVDPATLSENTRLERALKAHYQSGKAIYDTFGYFL